MVSSRIPAVMVLTALAVAACAHVPQQQDVDDGLAGTSWRFVEIYGAPVTSPVSSEGREAQLSFSTHNRIYSSDGCNRLMGSYTLQNDQITLSEMGGMQMVCLDTSTRRLSEALKDAEHGSIEGTLLTLYGNRGQTLAILERLPPRT